jgi:hypothetical protein
MCPKAQSLVVIVDAEKFEGIIHSTIAWSKTTGVKNNGGQKQRGPKVMCYYEQTFTLVKLCRWVRMALCYCTTILAGIICHLSTIIE